MGKYEVMFESGWELQESTRECLICRYCESSIFHFKVNHFKPIENYIYIYGVIGIEFLFLNLWKIQESNKSINLKPRTYDTYETQINYNIIPEIGDIPLIELKQQNIQKFYKKIR